MKILHIETSSRNCSVAVSDGEELLCLCEEVAENYRQSESLHTFVKWAMEGAGLDMNKIEAISLGKGPGSYTGLRIGASAAKGFCYGLNIPLVATNSLETLAEPFIGQGYDVVIALVDARRMEVYAEVYEGVNGDILAPTEAVILDENSFNNYSSVGRVLLVGDGAAKASGILSLPNAKFKSDVYPSAKYLLRQATKKISNREFESVAYFEPFYLKEFQGVKLKKSE